MFHLQVLAQLPNLSFSRPVVRHLPGRQLLQHRMCVSAAPPSLQVLAQLPNLETADLSFNIYMEAAASLAPLTADGGLVALRRLDLRCSRLLPFALGVVLVGKALPDWDGQWQAAQLALALDLTERAWLLCCPSCQVVQDRQRCCARCTPCIMAANTCASSARTPVAERCWGCGRTPALRGCRAWWRCCGSAMRSAAAARAAHRSCFGTEAPHPELLILRCWPQQRPCHKPQFWKQQKAAVRRLASLA